MWAIAAFSILSFALAIYSIAFDCKFVKENAGSRRQLYGRGIFHFEESKDLGGSCSAQKNYSGDYYGDGGTKAARAFGVISLLLIGFALVILAVLMGRRMGQDNVGVHTRQEKIMGWIILSLYGTACITQILAIIFVFSSELCDNHYSKRAMCKVGPGAVVAALNALLLLFLCILVCFMNRRGWMGRSRVQCEHQEHQQYRGPGPIQCLSRKKWWLK